MRILRPIPIIVVLVVATAALGSCTSEDGGVPSDSLTEVRESAFDVSLPGRWSAQEDSDPDAWVYRGADGDEQLTVSVFDLSGSPSKQERSDTLHRLVQLRMEAETGVPGADVEIADPAYEESGGIISARYAGLEPETARRFHCLVLGGDRSLVVFYYESLGIPEEQSDERAQTILDSADVSP